MIRDKQAELGQRVADGSPAWAATLGGSPDRGNAWGLAPDQPIQKVEHVHRGATSMGKRANIAATAANSQALAQQAKRQELVDRGLLDRSASVADAVALDRKMRRDDLKATRARVQREAEDSADPKSMLIVGAIIVVPLVLLAIVFSSPVLGWIAGFVGACFLVALMMESSNAEVREKREASQQELQQP